MQLSEQGSTTPRSARRPRRRARSLCQLHKGGMQPSPFRGGVAVAMGLLLVAVMTAVVSGDESPPSPAEDRCFRELDLTGCWSENPRDDCDECVANRNAARKTKFNCTDREEMAYCDGPEPTPGPISRGCRLQLIKTCEPYGGNHGTVRECDRCVEKNRPKETNCTVREELSFCLPEPPKPAPEDVCERDLKAECGELVNVTGKETECVACVAKIEAEKKPNCTKRQEETFCSGPLSPPVPPPAPGPAPSPPKPSQECEERLKELCEDERKKGMAACDQCVKTANATLPPRTCTRRALLLFCETGPVPTPSPPPPPPPPFNPRNPCERKLMTECATRRHNATECDACAKEMEKSGKANCTRPEIKAFC
jgi:hypothetical protein